MEKWTDNLKLCNSYCSEEEIKKMHRKAFIYSIILNLIILILTLIYVFSQI